MKKLLFSNLVLLFTTAVFAQPQHGEGSPKPPPPAERWKRDSTKLQLYVNLTQGQVSGVKAAFTSFYNAMDAAMQKGKEAPPSKEEIDGIKTKRRAALKSVFTPQQMQRFETFEKEFMPPPPRKPLHRKGVDPGKL